MTFIFKNQRIFSTLFSIFSATPQILPILAIRSCSPHTVAGGCAGHIALSGSLGMLYLDPGVNKYWGTGSY